MQPRRRPLIAVFLVAVLSETVSACAGPVSSVPGRSVAPSNPTAGGARIAVPSPDLSTASPIARGSTTPTPARTPDDSYVPGFLAFDAKGQLYVSTCDAGRVFQVAPDTAPVVVVGNGAGGFQDFTGDGHLATLAQLSCPLGLAFDTAGDLFVVDHSHGRVRMVDRAGLITTVAGGDAVGFHPGIATRAGLEFPNSVAFDAAGNLYITDRSDRIFRVDRKGTITVIAGIGRSGFFGDRGPATSARLDDPAGIAFDAHGNLFIADSNNNRIRRIDRNGIITTVAGTGESGSTGDGGPATMATLADPESVIVDPAGNLYVGEAVGNRVRRIDVNGVISAFAGTGVVGFSGDGGPAVQATLAAQGGSIGLAIDRHGNIYIADSDNDRVRVVDAGGTITTYTGGS